MLPGEAPVANPPLENDVRTRLADMEARMSDMNVTISKLVESNSKLVESNSKLVESNVTLETDNMLLKKEMEKLKMAQAMTQDPRLRYFGVSVSGSNSRSSRSDSSNERAAKSEKAARLRDVKAQVKNVFGPTPTCFFCGTTEAITIAHIVSTGEDAYDDFGSANRYRNPLDVFSARNFIPLCGTLGQRDSCHDAYDKHLVAILHNPFEQRYFLFCADEAPGRLVALSQAPGHSLKLPVGWTPYHRLLAWRAQYSAMLHRYNVDFTTFRSMNALSEGAESVADGDTEDIDGDLDESNPSQGGLESGPSDARATGAGPESGQQEGVNAAPRTIP